MITLNPFAISGLLIALTYLPLFLFIIIKGKTKIARIYSLHILSVFVWGAGAFWVGINTDQNIAGNIWKFTYSGVILIPVFFYHAVALMTERRAGLLIPLTYLQAIYFLNLLLTNKLLPSTRHLFNSFYWYVGAPSFLWSFILWAIIVSAAHLQLMHYYKRCYPEQRKQIFVLILAVIGFFGGSLNFLPGLGFDIYPWGNFLVPIHSMIVTYAILKHQLLGIKVAIRKGVVYTILILLISLLYLTLVLLFEKVLQGAIGYQSTFISIVSAFFIGILFFPLRNHIQKIVDKIIFQKTPEEFMQENVLLRQEVSQSEKMKAVATLASGLAHEIKNPLTAVKTFSEHLPGKLDDKEFLKKFSRIVGTEVTRIDGLVDQLLEFAKPSPPKLEKTDINKLIRNTLDLLNSKFIQHKIKLTGNPGRDHKIYLNIDPNQIKQALLNIFLNSIEAMPDGGTLTISTKLQSSSPTRASIRVQDSGKGISRKDIPHIFDPFFSKKDQGTGLGLSITHGIITEHGGTINVESSVGQGTTFVVEIPFKPSPS